MIKTAKSVKDIPRGSSYIQIDFGNEWLYVYGFDNKSYIEIKDRTLKPLLTSRNIQEVTT